MTKVPEAKIRASRLPSATFISAALIPSDSNIAARFFRSASTCICIASCTRVGNFISPNRYTNLILTFVKICRSIGILFISSIVIYDMLGHTCCSYQKFCNLRISYRRHVIPHASLALLILSTMETFNPSLSLNTLSKDIFPNSDLIVVWAT